ncbi:MAG: XRE family transcriptional regulator [Candidatus Omnitrophota bacterium]
MKIGNRIRQLRKERKMTLQELSDKSGVQLATLSRMENNRMTGTLESHIGIVKALGIALADLYSEIVVEEKNIDVRTKKVSRDIFVHSDKSSFEILTKKVLNKKMMPILLSIESKGRTNSEEASAGTEKFLYVLEGEVVAVISDEDYKLGKSESIYFDATLPHYFKNTGKKQSKAICVITPPAL